MRAYLRALLFVAVLAMGATVILGTAAPARGEELLRYSSGASAGSGSSGRGRYAGYSGRQIEPVYHVPASSPEAITYYWYSYPQPVYQIPVSSPGTITYYWYYYPQPAYQVPASNPGVYATNGYYYSIRR